MQKVSFQPIILAIFQISRNLQSDCALSEHPQVMQVFFWKRSKCQNPCEMFCIFFRCALKHAQASKTVKNELH